MLHHLFRSIYKFFRPNVDTDGPHKEPISMKKLGQGYAAWSAKKMVLGWELNTKVYHLRLTPKQKSKLRAALDAIPTAAYQVSLPKWRHLLGLLRSITPEISGAQGMLTLLKHALWQARVRQVQSTESLVPVTRSSRSLQPGQHTSESLTHFLRHGRAPQTPQETAWEASARPWMASGSSEDNHFPQRHKPNSSRT